MQYPINLPEPETIEIAKEKTPQDVSQGVFSLIQLIDYFAQAL
jgi:hypothetical protein